jgi:PTH2 family peptidyl-tRNA hydrolase
MLASALAGLGSLVGTSALGPLKQVLLVRTDLGMRTGKVASQCAHAAVYAVEQLVEMEQKVRAGRANEREKRLCSWYERWRDDGQTKVVLAVKDAASMMELVSAAERVELLVSPICDAGRTQVASGSWTCTAIGPGPAALIDQVTGALKLL